MLAATFRGLTNDVYFQVGLLTTLGLSAKNAILIVEFAKDLMDKEGKGLIEATLDAVRMRLRPILMTSLAFVVVRRRFSRKNEDIEHSHTVDHH